MATVLVTGGAGFIGSHLVSSLLESGCEVAAVDNFDPFYDRRIKEKNIKAHLRSEKYTFIEADIRDRDRLHEIFLNRQAEVVVHLAAKAGVRPSLEDPKEYVDVNVVGTTHVLDMAVQSGARKLIFASSSSVYGWNGKTPFSEEDPVLKPASPYGATKIAGEALCHSYSQCYGLPVTALRFFTVYGPGQRPDLAIHKFARNMIDGAPITLFGDGTTSRDYTFVSDIISGVRAAMEYDRQGYEVFNLGNDHPVRLTELVRALEEVLGTKAVIKHMPMQKGDVTETWANIRKAGQSLGYNPGTSLNQGLIQFAEWLKNQ